MDDDAENEAENEAGAERPDFELERVEMLPARRPVRRRVGPLTVGAGLALLAAVLVIANLSGAGAASQEMAADGSPTAAATLVPGPLILQMPNPATVGNPPACALAPTLDAIGFYLVPAFGEAPLWLSGFDDSDPRVVHFYKVPPRLLTPHGWVWRVLLVTNLHYAGPVTVTGNGPGGPLLFTQDGQTAMTSLTLDTRTPASVLNGWGDWETYIYLPGPGCYDVRATWPSGGWRLTFSAGR